MRSGNYVDDNSIYHSENELESNAGAFTSTSNARRQPEDSDDHNSAAESPADQPEEEKKKRDTPDIDYGEGQGEDLEVGPLELEKMQSRKSVRDPNLVTWDSPEDPANPKNWSVNRKWAAAAIVSAFTFISPLSSSAIAPAISTIAQDFDISNRVQSQLTLSIFVVGYAIGPLLLGPLSEVYGRVPVLQLANLFFLCWNIGCSFAQNTAQLIAFRFLSGLGGSAPLAIGGGVLSDCWKSEERGKSLALYSLAPLLGPAVGPIAGGFITQNTSWRWTFHAITITDAIIQLVGLFLLQETYGPKLLKNKADRLRKETGNVNLHTEFESPDRTLIKLLATSFQRPFRMLATQPIIQLLALYMAYIYGLMYLVLTTYPVLWADTYHESMGIGGLNYISLGLGFFFGAQIGGRLNDRIYRKLKKRNNNETRPEYRAPAMVPGAILVPIGLFWYGWSAQANVHWIMPNIGACLFAAGSIFGFQCIMSYLVDAYTRYAASAIGSATVLRSLCGFGFPLFAPYMYEALGNGWGNSLLGFISIALGIPGPFVLWKYGQKLREKSKFAAG
ncbi:MFS multidrug transporter [Lineolata rhizophorae]|uniref:MFS multidrug transporter n=1 Tax=Lineolata rhizophorae TaxID=578093 RepID=A0A6A6P998_9PEZI|nr:MFS multidrug transporter [Lineolata rhizophorae]